MDALILAGGQAPPDLMSHAPEGERALIELVGRPLFAYTLEALRNTRNIERIAIAGGPATLDAARALDKDLIFVPGREKMMQNVEAGLAELKLADTGTAIVTTSDIPLVTGANFNEVLEDAAARGLEAVYPITRREICEAQFPGGKRTYAKLKDGTFTAGNAVIVPGSVVQRLIDFFNAAYAARKSPIGMAKLLGPGFLLGLLTRQLTVDQLEAKLSTLAGCRFGAVHMQDASLAFDVDKLDDYEVARLVLESRTAQSQGKG
jgi:GTP:adenosylcobinamide-phosphate guanylyltransferase